MVNRFKAWALYSKSFFYIILVVIVTLIGSWMLTIYLKVQGVQDSLDLSATFGNYSDSLDYETKLNMVLEQEEKFPNSVSVQRTKARLFIIEGGRFEEGMVIAEHVYSQRDADYESVYVLSFAYTALGYPVLGEYYAKKSIEIFDSPRANLALAEAYHAQGRHSEALKHYKSAGSSATLEEIFYKRLIDGCLRLNDWKTAEVFATLRVRAAMYETYYFDVLYDHYINTNELDNLILYGRMYYNICMESEVPRVGEILGDAVMNSRTGEKNMLEAGEYYGRAFSVGGNYDVLFKAAKAYALGNDNETAKRLLADCITADAKYLAMANETPELEGMYE